MNLWIHKWFKKFKRFAYSVKKKDMQSWIVLLCLFTLEQVLELQNVAKTLMDQTQA
jgi:hypothetical protein